MVTEGFLQWPAAVPATLGSQLPVVATSPLGPWQSPRLDLFTANIPNPRDYQNRLEKICLAYCLGKKSLKTRYTDLHSRQSSLEQDFESPSRLPMPCWFWEEMGETTASLWLHTMIPHGFAAILTKGNWAPPCQVLAPSPPSCFLSILWLSIYP